jgi:hypothetical protein
MADVSKINWWQWIPIFGWRVVAVVESADEIPMRLPRNGAIIVGEKDSPKWIAFDCPCRSGHRILLNTDKSRRPNWSVSQDNRLSIQPSVDYQGVDRNCHYIIRKGRVDWALARQFRR